MFLKSTFVLVCTILIILFVLEAPAYSHEGAEITELLNKKTEAADLVFRGKVIDISYEIKAVELLNGNQLPFTVVKYQVDEVIKGEVDTNDVTLSFLGGAVVDDDGAVEKYLTVSLFPEFDVGDEDILFVRHAGKSVCPLVDCRDGRLRLIDGKIYNEDGAPFLHTQAKTVTLGEAEEIEEIITHKVFDNTQRLISVKPETLTDSDHADAKHFDIFSQSGLRLARNVKDSTQANDADDKSDYLDEVELTGILLSER